MDAKLRHVRLGRKVKIWHYVNIYGLPDKVVTIGNETQIGSFCEVKPGVSIGTHCRIHAFTFICEGTMIADFVFIGPRVTFLNDKYPSALTAGRNELWENAPPKVDHHAAIGGGAVIGPGVTIGAHAVVGMGAVVTKSVPEYTVVAGNPARPIGKTTDKKYAAKYSKK